MYWNELSEEDQELWGKHYPEHNIDKSMEILYEKIFLSPVCKTCGEDVQENSFLPKRFYSCIKCNSITNNVAMIDKRGINIYKTVV